MTFTRTKTIPLEKAPVSALMEPDRARRPFWICDVTFKPFTTYFAPFSQRLFMSVLRNIETNPSPLKRQTNRRTIRSTDQLNTDFILNYAYSFLALLNVRLTIWPSMKSDLMCSSIIVFTRENDVNTSTPDNRHAYMTIDACVS